MRALLLMFAGSVNQDARPTSECALPNLSDMADILDAAPETVSRVFSSMRKLDYLQDRQPHRERFSTLALRAQALLPGMTSSSAWQRSQEVNFGPLSVYKTGSVQLLTPFRRIP